MIAPRISLWQQPITKIMFAAPRKKLAQILSVLEQRLEKKTGARQMSASVSRNIAAKMTSAVARILAPRLAKMPTHSKIHSKITTNGCRHLHQAIQLRIAAQL
jgi:hypothetical protein